MAQDQRVEFLFAAQVTGQNELQRLTQAVDKLRQETEQLKGANAGLAASTDAVIRNGTRYNNALDAQSKELRNARQGTQQLGMQINDFATSVSTGASVSQAFSQQIGQVGYAMSMMGGKMGAVGAFLAGPWGAAITIAAMALSPLINKLGEVIFGAQKAESALDGMLKKQRQLAKERMAPAEAAMEINKIRGEIDKLEKATSRSSRGIFDVSLPAQKRQLQALKWKLAEYEGMQAASSFVAPQQRPSGSAGGSSAGVSGGGGGASSAKADPQAELQKRLQEAQLKQQADNLSTFQRLMDSILAKTLPEYESKMREAYAAQAALTSAEQVANADVFAQAIDAIDAKRISEEFKELNANLSEGLLPEIVGQLGQFDPQILSIIDRNEELRASFEGIGQTVSDAFQGMLTGAMSFKDGMKGIISSVINELWKLFVVQQIVGFVSGGISSITGIKLPGKAIGGSVGKNQPYMVGERGPELFIPGGSGTIIPNRNLGGGKGGNAISINVDARGSADPAAVRAQVQQGILEAAPAIIAAAEARTVNGLRRPRLGGVMQ